jgi:hypothetical protein
VTTIAPEVIESLEKWEEIADAARLVASDLDTGRFTLGDIANRCARVYGTDSIGKLATEIRVAQKRTLYDYAAVAARYQLCDRAHYSDLGLTFSHFKAAMRAGEDAELWLDRAADEGWPKAELNRQIAAAIGARVPPVLLYSGRGVVWQYADTNRPYLVLHDDVTALAQGLSVTVKVYAAEAE